MFLMGLQLNGGEIKNHMPLVRPPFFSLLESGWGLVLPFLITMRVLWLRKRLPLLFSWGLFSHSQLFQFLAINSQTLWGICIPIWGKTTLQIASFNDILGWYILAVASTFSSSSDLSHVGYIFLILVLLLLLTSILKPCLFYLHKFFFLKTMDKLIHLSNLW